MGAGGVIHYGISRIKLQKKNAKGNQGGKKKKKENYMHEVELPSSAPASFAKLAYSIVSKKKSLFQATARG